MRYRYFQPADGLVHDPIVFGPQPNGDYVLVFEGEVEGSPEEPIKALEKTFYIHNQDDRPLAQHIRSMSVGDVVELEGQRFVVAFMGFESCQEREINILPEVTLETGQVVPLAQAEAARNGQALKR